jgi:ABC-type transport system substrate-binding protein
LTTDSESGEAEMKTSTVRQRGRRFLALFLVLGLVAAACGRDSGISAGAGGTSEDRTVEEGDPDEGAESRRGGSITFAVQADTDSPWAPAAMICAVSCHQVIKGIYDTLTWPDDDGEIHGMLLDSIEPNDDFTEWTLTPRPGIEFHDGTPFDADALMDHFTRMRASGLVGLTLDDVVDHQKVGETVVLAMSRPWSHFPLFLAGPAGYVASPTWLAAVDAGAAEATEPVGTGPFVYADYRPGDSFTMTRNDDYWLTAPDGDAYPYLDEIEFVVQTEKLTRDNAVVAGDVDVAHTFSGDSIERLRGVAQDGSIEVFEMTERQETTSLMLNVADPAAAVSDIRIRRAMAHALDQDYISEVVSGGIPESPNGPFSPGSMGHLDDTGFPTFDPERARALVEEYEAEKGPAVVAVMTTADPFSLKATELYQQLWEDVGLTITIRQLEMGGEYIGAAIQGDFEAVFWSRHGGFDPDQQEIWWASRNAKPIGEGALNFGRIDDAVIDAALDTIRTSANETERTAGAEEISRRFGEQVYNIWLTWVVWAIPHRSHVHGTQTPVVTPDGAESAVHGIGATGTINLHQLWVDDAE